ncbi:MAG: DMT family transporter [Planktomarina sp.]|nr:DMT family transporter [Planktomarina sp.]
MLWIPVTLFAAFTQTFRFMFQKRLRIDTLSTGGATFARFLYAAPLISLLAITYPLARGYSLPVVDWKFWVFAAAGGFCQVSATMCVVALFQQRNFTVGITFKKIEVLLAVGFGLLILGEGVSLIALGSISIGVLGVLVLSDSPQITGSQGPRFFNRATALGLSCGVLFGACAVFYRGATLHIWAADVFARASVTLMAAILMQLIGMVVFLTWREPGQIKAVLQAWRVAIWVGVLSLFGSLAWFTAFALQNAAYVKALGQVEILASFAISFFVFGEKLRRSEVLGILLLIASVVLLLLLL